MPKHSAHAMARFEDETTPVHRAETECLLTTGLAPRSSTTQRAGSAAMLVANSRIPAELADLNHYGEPFSDFLDDWTASHAPFAHYRYLGDLTRLGWHCHTAYYAADDPPFDFKALARAGRNTADILRLRLSPSLRLLQSPYPVMEIRDANLYHEDAAQVRIDELPEYLVVSRPGMQMLVERVDTICLELLLACQAGRTPSKSACAKHGH